MATYSIIPGVPTSAGSTPVSDAAALPVTFSGTVVTAGDVAHDAADSGNPVKIGGVARTSEAAAVTNGDRVNASFSATGRLLVSTLVNGTFNDGITVSRPIAESGNERAMAVGPVLYDQVADVWDRQRAATNSLNSTGTGIPLSAPAGQFDDTATSSVTENRLAMLRISADRRLMTVETSVRTVNPTFTVSTTPDYSAGDVIDTFKEVTLVNSATVRPVKFVSLVVKDTSGQAPAITVILLKTSPSGGTYTDNAALVWGASDLPLIVAVVRILATDWITIAGQSFVSFGGIDVECAVSATSLYALVVADATWNAAATTDLSMEFGFEQR